VDRRTVNLASMHKHNAIVEQLVEKGRCPAPDVRDHLLVEMVPWVKSLIQIRCHRPLPSHHRLATAQKPKNKALKACLKVIAVSEKLH
jgi:hypothetical protein